MKCITHEAKALAHSLDIDDRVMITSEKEAYITLKDHKPNFLNNPTCRLINPTKSELGKVSKRITESINRSVLQKTNLNLWRSTESVIDWFEKLENKQDHSFIVFDVVNFYPSITNDLLLASLNFASTYTNITEDDRKIILHTKNSLLISNQDYWTKKKSTNFDITMGSYDGAETCELVGLYILHTIRQKLKGNYGLYRDDGLAAIKASPQQAEKIKKQLCTIFKGLNLDITVDANKRTVNFLDVTFNLEKGIYAPYMKPNSKPSYVSKYSNHPPQILKNLPKSINTRLSKISSNESEFNRAAPTYQRALQDSGYSHILKHQTNEKDTNGKNRKRHRNITWFNPPFTRNVATNIGKKFFNILDREFPKITPYTRYLIEILSNLATVA